MFVISQFPYSNLNFYSVESEEKCLFNRHVWISSYSVNRIGERTTFEFFHYLEALEDLIEIKYFPIEIGIF